MKPKTKKNASKSISKNILPENHPLRSAHWIWPNHLMYLINLHAQFRRDFVLGNPPAKAPFFITADKAYKLYVNGVFVCRGPARGYQSHWPFDEVDLASHLKVGANWISVEAYNPGISTFQYIHESSAGLLCAAKWGSFELYSNGEWMMRRSPAHARETARYSLQIDFQEHVDARLDDRAWIFSPKPPERWRAEIFPDGSQQFLQAPFGRPPYDTVEERGIPLLRETVMIPEKVSAHTTGKAEDGWREWRNASWGFSRECSNGVKWDSGKNIPAKKTSAGFSVRVEPPTQGSFRAVCVALPEYAVGNISVAVAGGKGGEILDFQTCERMVGDRPALHDPGRACVAAMANRLILRDGETRHEFFHPLGFRVIILIVRDLAAPIDITLSVRDVCYPFEMKGTFDCSDATLNAIHEISRRTQKICSLDAYVDTPWREQAQWWGDARIQAKNTFYLDGDARLFTRGIRSIAGQDTTQGLTFGHAPTIAYNCILPDFSLTWIMTIWDLYWQTGDTEVLVEQMERIRRVLSYFDLPQARHKTGLLRYDRRLWLFEDWSTLYKGEIPTFLNLWFLVTLRALSDLCRAAGKNQEAGEYKKKAATHEALVVKHLYDKKQKLFIGGLDEKMKVAGEISVHDQTLALILGLRPEARETMIQKKLLPYLLEGEVGGPIPSAFWSSYVFEEMGKLGYEKEVLAFIKKKWTPMIETGTTWEGFGWEDGKGGGTVSHAWSAHPSFHLVNLLTGVRQTAAAWKEIVFCPKPLHGLTHSSAKVPSPKGEIAASWKKSGNQFQISLSIPAGVTAKIEAPGFKAKISGPKKFRKEITL